MLAVACMQMYHIIALTTAHNQMCDMVVSSGDSCTLASSCCCCCWLGINVHYTVFQMPELAHSRLHDSQTLICACRTLVFISSSSSSSRATGRKLLEVGNSLMQLLGCINNLQDQGQCANVFCTPTRCRQATRVSTLKTCQRYWCNSTCACHCFCQRCQVV